MQILPFQGILYDTKKVNLNDVVTLPYDKITAEQRSLYEKRSPYNMVHLILPKSHENAKVLFDKWQKEGVIREDKIQSIYIYEQEYEYPKRVAKTRRGFIALLKVMPFGKDTIMPHERTFSKIVEERMQLLDSTQANIEQIFILYNGDNISKLLDGKPARKLTDEFGITHKLWGITNAEIIKDIQKSIDKAQLFIADGHHRYTAALMYEEKMKGDDYVMATFVDSNDPGLTILPTHRVLLDVPELKDEWLIEKLKEYFIVKKQKIDKDSIGVYLGGDGFYSLNLKKDISLDKTLGLSRPRPWLYLDVNILHLLIIKHIIGIDTQNLTKEGNIVYLREEEEAIKMVKNKKARIAFLLNPTRIEQVKEIVSLSEVMPHKSTDFYPKLHSGLVMRKF